jgi:hypothetical protein
MSYTDALQGLPLDVVQNINEMLEEILIKAGSETEMKEYDNDYADIGQFSLPDSEWKKTEKEYIELGKKIVKTKFNGDIGKAYDSVVRNKREFGGDFQAGVYASGGALVGNQKRIDLNKNGKIDAEDFKLLRSSMNGAWRNDHKHVNHNEDYEVRYAKPKPHRKGYKGARKFGEGGGISNFERLSRVVAKNYEGKRVKPKYQKEYGKTYSKSEAKEVGNKVAGKVKANQKMATGGKTNRGGIMVLAKKIRKDGESWKDALKRAGQQQK